MIANANNELLIVWRIASYCSDDSSCVQVVVMPSVDKAKLDDFFADYMASRKVSYIVQIVGCRYHDIYGITTITFNSSRRFSSTHNVAL